MRKILITILALIFVTFIQAHAQAQTRKLIKSTKNEDKILLIELIEKLNHLRDFNSNNRLMFGAELFGSLQGAARALQTKYGQLNVLLQNALDRNFQVTRTATWKNLLYATYRALKRSLATRVYLTFHFFAPFNRHMLIKFARENHLGNNLKLYEVKLFKNILIIQLKNLRAYPVRTIFDLASYIVDHGFGYVLTTGDGDRNAVAKIIYVLLTSNTPEAIKRAYLNSVRKVYKEVGGDPIAYILSAKH